MLPGFELLLPKDLKDGLWLIPPCWDPKLHAETTFTKPKRIRLEELPLIIQSELREYPTRTPPDPFIPEKEIRGVARGCASVIGRQTPEGQIRLARMKRDGGWWTEDGRYGNPLVRAEDEKAFIDAIVQLSKDLRRQ